jgi:geranylgeranyl reductase family protein
MSRTDAADVTCHVLVVGAGPAGAATAAGLARAGRDALLVEARRHPRAKACAEYASPRIVDELDRLGLDRRAWEAHARTLAGMRVILGAQSLDVRYTDASGRARSAFGLERTAFDAALAAHAVACGARLIEGTTLVRLERRAGRVVGARVRSDGRQLRVAARWMVGADGARSRTARLLGVERPLVAPRRLGLVAHYAAVPGLDDHGEMHVGPGWYVGLAPLTGGRLNVGMALPMGHGTAASRFADGIEGLPAVAERLRGSRPLTPIRGSAPIGHRVAIAAGPGWLLVGDAAGFIDPFTGEGIYRALRSARAAASALHELDDGAAERYLAERRRAFAAKDALTWLVQGMLAAPPLMRYALRRLNARPAAAALLGSALGDLRPASHALSPRFLAEVLRP